MVSLQVDVSLSGKIVDPRLNKDLTAAINDGLMELAQIEGANHVKSQLYPGHGFKDGNLKNHIGSQIVSDLVAQVDAGEARYGSNLIYATWVEGISRRNAISSFKGYRMFRNMFRDLRSNRAAWQRYVGGAILKELKKG